MNTRFLESFILVVKLGSFRAAAEQLHITQATISNRIASLEEEIGAKVFLRDAGDLKLTPVGLRLIALGERMLELQQYIMQLGQTNPTLLGSVRIGAIDTIVHTWLLPFIQHLQSAYPAIEVQLSSESTDRLNKSLRDGDVDIALQTDQLTGEGIVSTACLPMAMGWVGPASMAGQVPDTDTLLSQPIVTMSRGSQPYLALKDVFRQAGRPMGKVHNVNSIAALVRLVRSGFGNALVPLPPVREEIERGELVIIPNELPLPRQGLVVSYLETRASESIRFVAALACEEADRYMRSMPAPFAAV